MGCSNTANSSPCDDNNRCTENDICASKACKGTRISGCLFCGDDFLNPLGGEQCDDGNAENGDCCSSTCRFEAANGPCEDGLFCTVEDTCNATGTCVTGVPNTCADTNACTADYCDEDLAA
jgi:cysteine-rich repeat protein